MSHNRGSDSKRQPADSAADKTKEKKITDSAAYRQTDKLKTKQESNKALVA